jgi:zinc/manganese transport system substrate-binding protein
MGMNVLRVLLAMALAPLASAEVKVAVLHPLLGDLAKRVGGGHVQVVDLIGAQGDPHRFEPGAKELRAAKGAQLYLVSGKGLEPYLPKLKGMVGKDRVVEVGKTLPTLKAEVLCEHDEHAHVHEEDDPHWWHSIDCWRRAARIVAKELSRVDPVNAAHYGASAKQVRKELGDLRLWTEKELSKVPKDHRVLATAHAAFAYFCNEHGWKMLPVQGLNREQVASPKFVSEVADAIRKEKVLAVFPEKRSNPKMLKTVAKGVGVKVGEALLADGGDSIDAMFRHNVAAIVAALGKN